MWWRTPSRLREDRLRRWRLSLKELNGSHAPPPKRYKADDADAYGSGESPVNNAVNPYVDYDAVDKTGKPLVYLVGVLDTFYVYM